MYKPLFSCCAGLVVALVIGLLLWKTVRQAPQPGPPTEHAITDGDGKGGTVLVFTTQKGLADLLMASMNNDRAGVTRSEHAPSALSIADGTRGIVLGFPDAGQAKVKLTTGPHRGEIVYMNYRFLK